MVICVDSIKMGLFIKLAMSVLYHMIAEQLPHCLSKIFVLINLAFCCSSIKYV